MLDETAPTNVEAEMGKVKKLPHVKCPRCGRKLKYAAIWAGQWDAETEN